MTHKKRSPQEWQHLIQQQQSSSLSIADFCRQHALNPSTFYLQRKKLNALTLTPAATNDWLPFAHHEPSNQVVARQWEIELKLPNGVVLNMSTQG
jgi:hypothetical protein